MHFLFCDRIQKDCSPLSAACINDLPAWAKSLVSLPRPLRLCTFFTSSSIWNFYIFLTETKVSFPKASCCLFVLLIYNCWQQSGTNPINCFSIRQICQIPPNPNKFPTTRISRFCNKICTFFLCALLNNFFVWWRLTTHTVTNQGGFRRCNWDLCVIYQTALSYLFKLKLQT